MDHLRIYRIEDKYIRFLHSRDSKVQYNKGTRRPYVGIVLFVGQFRYFVPMESPKANHAKIKPGKHILKMEGGNLGLLGFNNMVPVPESALIRFDIANEPDPQYRDLLFRQAAVCNRMKADIYHHASQTYYDVVNGRNSFLLRICCNFRELEKASLKYDPNHQSKPSEK